jgi:hypothetical protein
MDDSKKDELHQKENRRTKSVVSDDIKSYSVETMRVRGPEEHT